LNGINAEFHTSPSPFELPDLGRFDHIVLNAVWEHMLPAERPVLLPLLLDTLSSGGFLFVCETPHRWFPVETHTTHLPLINYLPAPLAHKTARLSDRVGDETWEELLRIEDSDLAGLTFYVAEPEQTRSTLDGRDAVGVKCNDPDHTGRRSIPLPWSALEFPRL
jgi:hypothetical protein